MRIPLARPVLSDEMIDAATSALQNERFVLGESVVFAMAAYYPILAFFDDPILLTILWVIPIYPALIISSTVLIADLTSESERARTMGTLGAVQSIATAVGPIASGTSAELIGPKLTMLSSSVFTLGAALFGQYKVKSTSAIASGRVSGHQK